MPKWKSIRTLALIGLVVVAGAACTADRKPAPGTSGDVVPSASSSTSSSSSESGAFVETLPVTAAQPVTGTYAFDTAGVQRVAAGDVLFSFTNSDTDRHEARLIRVLDGNVGAYRTALMANGVDGVKSLGVEAAALGPNDPAKTASTTVSLTAGVYVIVDFLPTSDGTVFAQHGLLRELSVVAG